MGTFDVKLRIEQSVPIKFHRYNATHGKGYENVEKPSGRNAWNHALSLRSDCLRHLYPYGR
jgi:hypothetical protein